MKKPLCLVCLSLILIGALCLPIGQTQQNLDSSDVLIVDNEGDGDFRTISAALNHAQSGDHIKIYSGQYNETLNITTNNLIIEGIEHELGSGTDNNYPTLNGQMTGSIITIHAKGCQISGLILTNSGHQIFDAGIKIYNNDNIIQGNGIWGNHYGILLNNCSGTIIKGNAIIENQIDGIFLGYTWDNTIEENILKENGFQGIFLIEVSTTIINKNTIYLNDRDGIQLRSLCTQNTIIDNEIHTNGIDGIKIWEKDVSSNLIKNNQINNNEWNGIHIMEGYDNTCCENDITLNLYNGIHLGSAYENYIIRNQITDNKNNGIQCFSQECQHNKIYYNNINDGVVDYGTNQWDDGIGNGGNYWSYYTGQDEDDDGIGDIPQTIEGNGNKDDYPFIEPFSPPQIPNTPLGLVMGSTGTMYTYSTTTTDSSFNMVQYGWDWDGDFIVDEWSKFYKSQEPCDMIYQWDETGTYAIRVKAMDNYGFQSDWSDPLHVSMPKTHDHWMYEIMNQILQWFKQNIRSFFIDLFAFIDINHS